MTHELDRMAATLADRYIIEREVGAGGMATVYLAEDVRHRRKVAVKVLHPELSAVIGSERFLKEIELTANLQHPHILPLFDSGDANGQLYYVMPFIEGETLRGRLDREQQLPVGDVVRIAREVADALGYAHKRGVVHRDIKPENILLQDGHALVADFGIALAVQQAGAGRLTQTGLSLGTPQYMSPEQAMGERTIDARADIYALGAVTYEMLAGEPPFTGPTAQAIIARAMTERPRSLTSMRETLSPAVDHAVMTALAKLPADRFATAGEFADALTRDGTAVHTADVGGGTRRRTASRRAMPWAMLAVGLAAGAFAATTIGRARATSGSADSSEPRFWSIALPDSAPFVAGSDHYDMFVRSLDISADGQLVVWSTVADGAASLWQMRTAFGTASPIASTKGVILPTLSPDGKSLAFVVDDQVRRLNLTDGSVSRVASEVLAEGLWWPAPDRVLMNNYSFSCLMSAPASGGEVTRGAGSACVRASGGVYSREGLGKLIVSAGGIISVITERTGTRRALRKSGTTDTTDRATLVAGESPFLVGDDLLIFLTDSTVYGASVDLAGARLTSEPRQILVGVRREAFAGAAQMALSASGTLVWVAGSDGGVSRFVFVSPSGARDTLRVVPSLVNSYALSSDGRRLAYSVTLPGNRSVLRIVDLSRNVVDSTRFAVEVQVLNWVDADSAISVYMPQAPSGRRLGIVRGHVSAMTLDYAEPTYHASSRDGRMRCNGNGLFWPTAAPSDSVRVDRTANWCRFSPDGRFISWVTQAGEVFVAPTDRTAPNARRKLSATGADEPRWSRDGQELVYRAGNQWLAIPVAPAANGALPSPRRVHRGPYNQAHASWDMAPDGRLLLLQGAPPARATHLNVITNFPRYAAMKVH